MRRMARAPLLSVFGGKITTYRRLAEAALEKLEGSAAAAQPTWTAGPVLPGGDFPDRLRGAGRGDAGRRPWRGRALAGRLVRAYGTKAETSSRARARWPISAASSGPT